jgi:plastocyanin
MTIYVSRKLRKTVLWLMVVVMALALSGPARFAKAEAPVVKKFQLYATDGYMTLPGGEQVYVWGYSLNNEPGSATYPAPTLEVDEGDQVEVTLTNIGAKKKGVKQLAHTIHWHGLDTDQQNDGVPHTSPAIQVGESFTYHFTADHAGTYFYHCHVDTIEHLQMGMHGAFIVKAKNGVNEAWTGGPAYDKEYVFVLNEIDPVWHKAVENGTPYDRTAFHPTYWTINGKAYPDTEKDPTTMIEGTVGQKVLIRMVNSGYQPHSFHMHGYHFEVIASDGRALPQPQTKDTILIGPGERYDLLVTFDQDGMFPFHSHNIIDNTNNGAYPGGLHTMMEVGKEPAPSAVKTIRMKAGQKTATVDGSAAALANPPVTIQGTAYVPIRFIGEQLGADIQWLQSEQSVLISTKKTNLQLWLGKSLAKVDGKVVSITALPRKINGAVMVPIRFVADQLGASTAFDEKTREIVVTASVNIAAQTEDGSTGHQGHTSPDGSGSSSSGSAGAHEGHAGGTGSSDPVSPGNTGSGDPLTVDISNSAFVPRKLTVKKGQTVKWVNKDNQIHTVIDLQEAFDSKNLLLNQTFQYTFQALGTYTYYCSTHPSMQGEIIVTD